jgi:hypothetical protein
MSYEQRKYTEQELERSRYVGDKIAKLIHRGPFSLMFDITAGVLFGYAAANGLSVTEIIERLLYLTQHDSPDGRTSQELIDAFKKGGSSS